jgi:hypothetical protein
MLISPTLLDFLEQAIEPIPLTSSTNMSNANKAGKTGQHFLVFFSKQLFRILEKQCLLLCPVKMAYVDVYQQYACKLS